MAGRARLGLAEREPRASRSILDGRTDVRTHMYVHRIAEEMTATRPPANDIMTAPEEE